MTEEIKNIGFDLAKELAEKSDEDLQVGAAEVPKGIAEEVAGVIVAGYAWPNPINGVYPRTMNQINHAFRVISEFAKKWLPIGQVQRGIRDWMNCATNAPVNEYENQFNYALEKDLLSEDFVKWIIEIGYINPETGKFEASNAFNSIDSGTTQNGNSLKAPLQSITNSGLIPLSMLPDDKSMDWFGYHNPARITQKMRDVGKEFLRRLNAKNPTRALMYAQISYSNFSTYTKGLKYNAFDSYEDFDGDFIKNLAPDYNFLNYGYKGIINHTKKKPQKEEEGENMKLYKRPDQPEVYFKGLGDGLYHHVIDEPVFKGLFGDFSNVEIVEVSIIPSEIGFTIYDKRSLGNLFTDLILKLKGK